MTDETPPSPAPEQKKDRTFSTVALVAAATYGAQSVAQQLTAMLVANPAVHDNLRMVAPIAAGVVGGGIVALMAINRLVDPN